MGTTLDALSSGFAAIKWVVAIEGYKYLLTDASPAAAITAWSGYDWTLALGGLVVELQNKQRIDPYDPFTTGGSCKLTITDVDGTDQFGIDVYRRSAGAETVLLATIDRDDISIPVAQNTTFAAATSELHIGTECIEYSAKIGANAFGASKRGKYSPFAAGGTGSPRFGNHHRVAYDKNHVLLNPVVSQQTRVWLGRRVGVYMHTVDATGALNTRAEAQLAFAGIVVGIADDANVMGTRVELKNILDVVQDSTLGRDIYGGEIGDGLYLQTGRKFQFNDFGEGLTSKDAAELAVVASGAAGANQINAGYYTGEQLVQILNRWLGSEKTAGRINGFYTWATGVTSSVGLRTKCYWRMTSGTSGLATFVLTLPGEASAFLGMREIAGSERGQMVGIGSGPNGRTNQNNHLQGDAVPFATLVFRPSGPGHAQEFAEVLTYVMQNERGVFVDQLGSLPGSVSALCPSPGGEQWGVFLLDEKQLLVASYSATKHEISNAWIAPWRLSGSEDVTALKYVGRRIDEPTQGPVTLRQIYVLTGTLQAILSQLFYGSGTAGYNHATYDTLGPGLGVGIPGELLGAPFDQSVANLPGAQAELCVIFDEATTLPDLIASDLLLRRASLRWRNEHLEFVVWQSPAGSLSRAVLSDANKAAPSKSVENHRAPTLESSVFQRAFVKIDYDRDFAVGRNGDYRKSIQLEDQVAVDDAGGETRPVTIKARNSYSDFQGTGAAIEETTKSYLATMPMFSRSSRNIRRSLDVRLWEGTLGVGDIVTVTDNFARDPATGLRGINSRYGTVIEHTYDPGGPVPGDPTAEPRPMTGEVEVRFTDVNRCLPYGPAARVDDTANTGGFSAGYNAATKTLRFYAHQYSEATELADAGNFQPPDRVKVTQVDPANPAAPLTWDDIVVSQTGNDIGLTTGLAGWDATKLYRITFDTYADTVTRQRDFAFEADASDWLVQDLEVAYHYAAADDTLTATLNTGTDKAAFYADSAYGDGASHDAGNDAELVKLVNMLTDRRTAHQNPCFVTLPGLYTSGPAGGAWTAIAFGPVYVGLEHLGSGVTRYLTVAPFARLSAAGTGQIRITLSRDFPQLSPSLPPSVSGGFLDSRFGDVVAQTTWTLTSTTLGTLADRNLKVNVKNLTTGVIWMSVEISNNAEYWGLAKSILGPRTLG